MQLGGNAGATAFFRQHGCTSNDAQQKYHSRAAMMYREKLHSMALKAMKQYGTKFIIEKDGKKKIHIDSHHNTDTGTPSPHSKEVDFFKEHEVHSPPANGQSNGFTTRSNPASNLAATAEPVNINNGRTAPEKNGEPIDPTSGPNVDAALSMSPTQAIMQAEPRKATIGTRKPTGAKKGLGSKKTFGAQKVKANFNDIENAALQRDKDRDQLVAMAVAQEAETKQEESKRLANMKLAYKDLGLEEKKRNEQMKNMDPKKKAQVERLGMGFGGSRESSHSAISEMKTIEQEAPTPGSRSTMDSLSSRSTRDYDDDFELISGFSSGPPKYSENPFGLKNDDKYSSWSNNSKPSWDSADRFDHKQNNIEEISSHSKSRDDDRGRSRKNLDAADGDNAQKKFGNAKAISSDAYFGKYDPDLEVQQKLSTYQSSSGISSADLFGPQGGGTGRGSSGNSRGGNYHDYGGSAGPDLTDIKEGVKHGVTKVAGKLSNLANGVINSIQDNYG